MTVAVWPIRTSHNRVLEERLARVSSHLEHLLARPFPDLGSEAKNVTSWDVVGVGASEAPARLIVMALLQGGIFARFVGVSEFLETRVGEDPGAKSAESRAKGLIVVSQGLSPNAQLALHAASRYGAALLLTSVGEKSRPERARLVQTFPGPVLRHPPEAEPDTLVRLIGPVCASLAALRVAVTLLEARGVLPPWADRLADVPGLYGDAQERAPVIEVDPSACLGVGMDVEFARCLMWKWQEGLYARLPLGCDVLGFAHGPLQSLFRSDAVFLTLERPEDEGNRDVFSRFRAALNPRHHRAVSIAATLPGPLAYFEFDAQISAMIVTETRRRGIDPCSWPGQGADGPLYTLSEPCSLSESEQGEPSK